MDTVVPQSFDIGDTSWKKVSLTILYIQSTGSLGKFKSTGSLGKFKYTGSLGKFKSTTFPLCQYTIYSSVLKNFDLQIYNFFTKLNLNSTGQNGINLQYTFIVAHATLPQPRRGWVLIWNCSEGSHLKMY